MQLPPPLTRRWFLRGSALSLAAAACVRGDDTVTDGTDATDHTDDTDTLPCPDPLRGGTLLGTLAFRGEDDQAVGQREGEELNGRLALDHSTLDADSLVTGNDDFFIRTMAPRSLPDPAGWSLAVEGLAEPASIALADLLDEVEDQGVVLLECSGNQDNRHFGLISAARWEGIPIQAVLDRIAVDAAATRIEIGGFDQHVVPSTSGVGCSWIYTFEELREAGAFLATRMNGEALPVDHGAPVRLVVPGWYGCCSAKWVDTLRLVDDTAPATDHMQEFAGRTHQVGTPALARDYRPARMQVSAMPVRVEQWDVDGVVKYRIVGIVWGGTQPPRRLELRASTSEAWREVEICPEQETTRTWTLWQTVWEPARSGTHLIELRAPEDDAIRLELGWYTRAVNVPA
jgi:DMSO/TMAO reductase YedYZ molybdopterin-dependent catalytic subunit